MTSHKLQKHSIRVLDVIVQTYRRYYCISTSSILHSFPDKETKALLFPSVINVF